MKTLYALGCSFMSDDTTRPDHPTFLQQFCQRNDYEYHCLARPGATNYAIRLQIDFAIRRRADFVVVGATSSDRINIVLNPEGWRSPVNLRHIEYRGYRCSSEQEFPHHETFIVSDTLANLLESQYIDIPKEKKDALRVYVADLHDMGLQYNIDGCVIRDGLNQLIKSQIPFIFIPGPTFHMGWDWLGDRLWPSYKKQPWDMPFGPYNINNHNPPEAHAEFLETLESLIR